MINDQTTPTPICLELFVCCETSFEDLPVSHWTFIHAKTTAVSYIMLQLGIPASIRETSLQLLHVF